MFIITNKSLNKTMFSTYSVLPTIVSFDFGENQINVQDMASTTCVMNKGDLPAEITWWVVDDFGNERRLITNDGIVITRISSRMSALSIESVQGRHRGNYSCVVKNNAGTVQYSAQLLINGEPRLLSCFEI